MKYKVIDYVSDVRKEQTGTCDLCFGTAWVENGSITIEDENGKTTVIRLTYWDWGDYYTIYIDNVVNFSAWLQERDVEPKNTFLSLVRALMVYEVDFYNYANQEDHSKLIKFLESGINQDRFARAWLDGYEVEKEKRYLVKLKNLRALFCYLAYIPDEGYWTLMASGGESIVIKHTRKQLEEAGFGWVFDCPGIEIEEVEE